MINEFIDRIIVHAPVRNGRDRTQKVEIHLNFIGNVEIPTPEPTPEEIEQMKKKQYWKDKYWKRRNYELARRRQKNAEKKAAEATKEKEERLKQIDELRQEIRASSPEKMSVLPKTPEITTA